MIHLVTGGARSGKSTFALREAEGSAAPRIAFVATATAGDADMAERIARHQEERSARFQTVEEPLALAAVLSTLPHRARIVDCLTLWVANLLFADRTDAEMHDAFDELARALIVSEGDTWVVTNEVGLGIVPADPLSRRYRDLLGRCNQRVAAAADRVTFLVAGLPLRVK